jgi:HD superfamily phosphohydrolase
VDFLTKRISDPVYGSMGFSEAETDVIGTPNFQRLRNIKHLGLVDYVFPGATYARFSHCLGTCHLTGRILDSLCKVRPDIEEREVQIYRMAALLHDVGHYPFSHAMDEAVEDHYKSLFLDETGTASTGSEGETGPKWYSHESLGKHVV